MLLKLLTISVVLILLIMFMNAAKKAQAKKAEDSIAWLIGDLAKYKNLSESLLKKVN